MTEIPEADAQEQARPADPAEEEPVVAHAGHAEAEAAEGDLLEQEVPVPVDDEY